MWPPGSKVYLGESVLLKCTVESNSTAQWGFEWDKPKTVLTLNPRHVVSNDSYFITAVTREDAGSYRCKAGQISSQPVELIVSGEQLQHLLCCVLFVCPNLLAGLTEIKIIMFKIFKLIKKQTFTRENIMLISIFKNLWIVYSSKQSLFIIYWALGQPLSSTKLCCFIFFSPKERSRSLPTFF